VLSRNNIPKSRRWVIKIGSAMLTNDGEGLAQLRLKSWVDQIAELMDAGHEIILVSSGAVAEGMARMGFEQRPRHLYELQAMAAIGQMGLIRAYETCFEKKGRHTAQILLTHDDLTNRDRYLNARHTLQTLIKLGVVPVVNENDTVATDELRFGDNDTLAALVANLIDADLLILLTDQEGLFDSDPRFNPSATLIEQLPVNDPKLDEVAGGSVGGLGMGGMVTKVRAARLAARSGTATIIASGIRKQVLLKINQGDEIGTLLMPEKEPDAARKRWLAGHLKSYGQVVLDDGAVEGLSDKGCSLLSVGVLQVIGSFKRGDLV